MRRLVQAPIVILVGTSHPGNVGAAARGAGNFGATELRFVAPRCDIHCKEALDRSVHAKELLLAAKVFDTLEEALEGIGMSIGTSARTSTAPNHFLRKPQDVRDWAESMVEWDGIPALVFGREDTGLTREEVNLLDALVTIPTADYASLNLAHAVTLLCYETHRIRGEPVTAERTLDPDAMSAMHRAFDALTDTVESRPWRQEVAKGVWRKMMGRSRPDSHEVYNVIGVLTRTLKRFNHPGFKTPNSEAYLKSQRMIIGEDGEE